MNFFPEENQNLDEKHHEPDVVRKLKDGLIVSCQASAESPLNHPEIIAAFASAAEREQAVAVRINGVADLRAVRRRVKIPVIGIEKLYSDSSPVYITPTYASVRRVVLAGADVVALDCTARPRPEGESVEEIVRRAKAELQAAIMADVATVEDGLKAAALGVDLVSTTLFGYTDESRNCSSPAFDVLGRLVREINIPVVLEGRVHTPDQVRRAFDLGAYAVVVGTAITNIEWLTRKFAQAAPRAR
jgi:N-acylglucosamine-6-phosphate 2-epimerase